MFHQFGEFGTFSRELQRMPCSAKAWDQEPDCSESTFHPPFCTSHSHSILGVEIQASPVAGQGLFARRTFHPGDVILPYVGDVFRNMSTMCASQQRRASPYAVMLPNGRIVDASCTRGMAAYINAPTRGSGKVSNVRLSFATIRKRDGPRYFSPPDGTSGMCSRRHRVSRLRTWKRIHHRLVEAMHAQPYPWIVATRIIQPGDELFMAYRNPVICRIQHETRWP